MADRLLPNQHQKKETFVVQVMFQQNSTWQGSITWTEQKKTLNFRSMLEMLKIMDEVLSREDGGDGGPPALKTE